MYSMESILPQLLYEAMKTLKELRVPTLGPLAFLLNLCIESTGYFSKAYYKVDRDTVYKACKLTENEIELYKKKIAQEIPLDPQDFNGTLGQQQ